MKKFLKVSRFILGNVCLVLFISGILARFTVSYNERINLNDISWIMFRISFILFSANMMITIILDTKFGSKQVPSANRAGRNKRVA